MHLIPRFENRAQSLESFSSCDLEQGQRAERNAKAVNRELRDSFTIVPSSFESSISFGRGVAAKHRAQRRNKVAIFTNAFTWTRAF